MRVEMANVFDILGIEPTNDFKTVKRAYYSRAIALHPDKVDGKEEEFKEVNNAYELVNDEKKLNEYHKNYLQGIFPDPENSTFNANNFGFQSNKDSAADYTESTTWLRKPKSGFAEVFVPIIINELNQYNAQHPHVFYVPKLGKETTHAFSSNFDFEQLANSITSFLKGQSLQVGVTFSEAEDIINQHSHREYKVMVEVRIPFDRLEDSKVSEHELCDRIAKQIGNVNLIPISNHKVPYLLLLQHTTFSAGDIISVRPMVNYLNTMRFSHKTPINQLWPEGLTVQNPKSLKLLEIELAKHNNSQNLLTIMNSSSEHDLKLQQAFLGDKILLNAIALSGKDATYSEVLVQDLLKLQTFYKDKMNEAALKNYDEAYTKSVDNFYSKALEIRLSEKPIKTQAKEIVDTAQTEFKHRHNYRRLMADVLMVVSILFAGLGLVIMVGRALSNKSVFFSQAKTAREEDLISKLKNEESIDELDGSIMRSDSVIL